MDTASKGEIRALGLGLVELTGGMPVMEAPARQSYMPDGTPPTRAIEIRSGDSYGTGTMYRVALGMDQYVDITAAHVGKHPDLLAASDAPADFRCARLLRPSAMTLPAGMSPSALNLFDVAILGRPVSIEAFKASCPRLIDVTPGFDDVWSAYGFPFGTGFGANGSGQPRSMKFQATADATGSMFFKSDRVGAPGMSGSPVNGGAAVLTGMAYFDDGSGPEHWTVAQALHNDMTLEIL